ncbi:MAG: hypothetical protein MJA29_08550 [Candidatus Omnitrophica bacterium]|nr:hypothetical protein [Candidatus Omnitrophota bacterium]
MQARGVSVVGILLIIVLCAIAATLAFPLYRSNIIESARSRVCEANLRILKAALDLYAAEHDFLPEDLSSIPPDYFRRASARVLRREEGVAAQFARVLTRWERRGLAHAGLLETLPGEVSELLTCPSDRSPPDEGGISYALNARLKGMSAYEYAYLPSDFVLIVDCDHEEFRESRRFSSRHTYPVSGAAPHYANSVTKDGAISRYFQRGALRGAGSSAGKTRPPG